MKTITLEPKTLRLALFVQPEPELVRATAHLSLLCSELWAFDDFVAFSDFHKVGKEPLDLSICICIEMSKNRRGSRFLREEDVVFMAIPQGEEAFWVFRGKRTHKLVGPEELLKRGFNPGTNLFRGTYRAFDWGMVFQSLFEYILGEPYFAGRLARK